MIDKILIELAELGLFYKDCKHYFKIKKKEKEDGIPRTFQKYFLQPSSILHFYSLVIMVIVSILVSAILAIYFVHKNTSIHQKNTEIEISKMNERMENWKDNINKYPMDLNELIGNSPLRQDWKNDEWENPYKYEIINNGKDFLITSAGLDGKFNTKDDIKSNNLSLINQKK